MVDKEGLKGQLVKGLKLLHQRITKRTPLRLEFGRAVEDLIALAETLEHRVAEHAAELANRNQELKQAWGKWQRDIEKALLVMALMAEARDPYIHGHHQRVAKLACAIAGEMGLSEEKIEGCRLASLAHDIGSVYIPSDLFLRPVPLVGTELSVIEHHPWFGYHLLKKIEFPWPVARIVFQHHERMNGYGYPLGISGEEILVEARILGVAEVVDAITSRRPHRPVLSVDKAIEEISSGKGVLYDADVVDACLRFLRKKGLNSSN